MKGASELCERYERAVCERCQSCVKGAREQ